MNTKVASRRQAQSAKKKMAEASPRRKTTAKPRTARLEARLPAHVYTVLKRAAEIQGRTLSDFVVTAAHDAARRAIAETQMIYVSVEDHRRIMEALLNPPEPNAALKKAFKRHRALFGD